MEPEQMIRQVVLNSIAEVEAYLVTTEGRSITSLTPAEVDNHCRQSFDFHFGDVVEEYDAPICELDEINERVYSIFQHHFHADIMRASANLKKFTENWS